MIYGSEVDVLHDIYPSVLNITTPKVHMQAFFMCHTYLWCVTISGGDCGGKHRRFKAKIRSF